MTPSAADDLWGFSLRVYGSDRVADACLWLQDHRAIDVNLLLYCCWLGARGVRLAPETLLAARQLTSPWTSEVVTRLRHARRWMKTQDTIRNTLPGDEYAALRERIKAAELEAERLEQRLLEQLETRADHSETQVDDALALMADNAARYLTALGIELDSDVNERLEVVLASASGSSRANAAREISARAADENDPG